MRFYLQGDHLSHFIALLSEEKNWKQLAENWINLIKNQDRWVEMGKSGRKHVEENYNIFKEVKKLEHKYTYAG